MRRIAILLVSAGLLSLPSPFAATAVATDPTPYRDAVMAATPIAYWRLDDTGSGTTMADASGNARNGTFAGSPTKGRPDPLWDEVGTAVGFNGSSQYATVAANAVYQTSTASVEAWFRSTDRRTQVRHIYNRGGSAGQTVFGIDSAQRLTASVTVGGVRYTVTGAADVTEGRWHHGAMTYDGAALRLYLDGVEVATSAAVGTLDAHAGASIGVGHASNTSGGRFLGDLDEVALYGQALLAGAVAAHHAAAGDEPYACTGATAYQQLICAAQPLSYYPLDDTDSIARDAVTPSNHGTFLNGATNAPGAIYNEAARVAGRFDGTDDRVNAPYDPYGRYATPHASLEAWFRLTTFTTADRTIVSRGNTSGGTILLGMRGGKARGRVYVSGVDYDVTGTTSIDDRRWHHLAVTYDGGNIRLFVDGAEQWTAYAVGGLPHGVGAVISIAHAPNSSAHTAADIDEVAIYDHALAPGAIAQRVVAAGTAPYSCAADSPYSNAICDSEPIGYWSLDEATGSAVDRTSYANDGQPNSGWTHSRQGMVRSAGGIPSATASPRLVVSRDDYGAYDVQHFSVEAWLRRPGSQNLPWFDTWYVSQVGSRKHWAIGMNGTSGKLVAEVVTSDGVTHRLEPAAGIGPAYGHFALTYDGSVIRLYANGVVVAARHYSGRVYRCYDVALCSVTLGVPTNTSSSSYPEVSFDEVALYDRALAPEELADHFLTGVPPELLEEATYGPTGEGDYAANPTGCCGDPVNTATGSFFDTWHDARMGGAGVQFDFTRSYNSADAGGGPLGTGWTHAYQTGLSFTGSGDATLRTASGQRVVFHPKAGGGYAGAPGTRAALTVNPNGTYTVTTKSQERLTFDSGGRLTAQVDRSGSGLSFSYTGSDLTGVTDEAGRTVTLAYSGGLLTSVTLPDQRHVDYAYTSGRLTNVTDLRGKTTSYTYDSGGRLASAMDSTGKQPFRNTYDPTTGRITSQLDALDNQMVYAWDPVTNTATITDARGGVTKHEYSSGNVLLRTVSAVGAATRYVYDDDLNLVATVDPRKHRATMTYDAAGNMLTRTAPAPLGYVETYTYNPGNDPLTVTDGRGNTTTYAYDSVGRLAQVTDRENEVTAYTYNAAGQVATVTDVRNGTTTYGYDAEGNRISLETPLGNKTTWAYDAVGRPTSVVEARGNVTGAVAETYRTHYTYDGSDRLLTITDALDRAVTRTYDDAGRLATTTDPEGAVTTYGYDAAGRITSVTWPDLTVTTNGYDAAGNVTSTVSPEGNTTTFGYDLASRRTSMTTPRGNAPGGTAAAYTWTFGYDAAGNQTTESHPAAGTATTIYDVLNRAVKTTDALGKSTTFVYDANGNVTSSTDPLGATHETTYDKLDRAVTETDPLDEVTTTTYDAAGNTTSVTTPLGKKTMWTYDADQRVATMVDPRGNEPGATAAHYATTYAYDAANHVVSVTDALGHVVEQEYDGSGAVVARVDENGRRTEYAYDDARRLASVIGPDLGVTSYSYDVMGNLVSRTDANNHVTGYDFDGERRLTGITDPLGRVTLLGYDRDGNLSSRETPLGTTTAAAGDGTVTAGFDAAGRRRSIDYSDGTPDVAYTYDLVGRLTAMGDGAGAGAGAQTYTYDDAGRLKTVSRNGAGFAYDYDLDGRLTQRTYPDGTVVGQVWDGDDHVSSVTAGGATTSFGYDAAGNLTSTMFPSGVGAVETRAYDRAGRLTEVATMNGSTVIAKHALTLDDTGNPLSRATTRGVTTTTDTYEYDEADRLAKVCYGATCGTLAVESIAYTYDDVGNRVTEARTGSAPSSTGYAYDAADQLTQTTVTDPLDPLAPPVTTSYTYDANGRQTAEGARTSTWGLDDRLSSTTASGTTTSFTYDGDGRRLTEATNGTVDTRYAWDLADGLAMLAVEATAAGATQRRYVNVGGAAVSMTTGGASYYYAHDPLGSVTDVLDGSGSTQWEYGYEPFGAARAVTQVAANAPVNPVRFAGERLDDATGDYHLRARQYDPSLGRFLSTDPLAPDLVDPYVATYVYVRNRATLLTDPSGMDPFTFVGDVVGGIYDASADNVQSVKDVLTTNPKQYWTDLEQVYRDNDEGGLSGNAAVFNQFNPAYHALVLGDGFVQSVGCGDYRQATRNLIHLASLVRGYAKKGSSSGVLHSRVKAGNGFDLPEIPPNLRRKISAQKQARHVHGTEKWASRQGGYFNSPGDAQKVLDAVFSGEGQVLGRTSSGHLLVRVDGVIGYNNNPRFKIFGQETNVFLIKGTTSPSVVPTSPYAKPV